MIEDKLLKQSPSYEYLIEDVGGGRVEKSVITVLSARFGSVSARISERIHSLRERKGALLDELILPVVILESLAAGKPIIASDIGGVKDATKDRWNGFLIEQKSSDQIVEKASELLNERGLRLRFSKSALETAKEYDRGVIVEKYEKIIKTVRGIIW